MRKEVLQFLLYGLPECFLLLAAALSLTGIKIRPRRLLLSGLSLGVLGFFARFFLFRVGMHTPVYLAGIVLALLLGLQLPLNLATVGCFLSYFLLVLGESLVVLPIVTYAKIPLEKSFTDPWLGAGLGWLSATPLVLAVLVCQLTGASLVKPAAKGGGEA